MQGKLINFKTNSQCSKILDYLKAGNSLTVMEALKLGFGANLRSRISNLKDAGYDIKSEMIKTNTGFVAKYSLNNMEIPKSKFDEAMNIVNNVSLGDLI